MKTMKIYGPPGTGKTTTLISTLKKLLERGYHPSEIAFLTHTKAAAEEARDRIALEFTGYDLKKDFKWFRTFHSACCGVLGISGNEIVGYNDLKKFSAESDWTVKGSMTMEMAVDETAGVRSHDIIINARSMASNMMLDIEDVIQFLPDDPALASRHAFLADYDEFKESIGKKDFVDMLEMAEGKALPVKVILADECQDNSDRQWSLLHGFAANCDYLYIAGDDDQAIYEFMGSSKNGFLEHPHDRETILHTSYRCAEEIGKASDSIIRRVETRQEKQIIWRDTPGSVERSGLDITDLPWREYMDGDQSIMVLFRHQKQCYTFGYKLQDLGIPYTVRGKSPVIGEEAELIKLYLRMKHEGATATAAQIGKIMRKAGDTKAASDANKTAENAQSLLAAEDVPSKVWDTDDWPRMFGKYDRDRKRLNQLRSMINEHGLDIIGKTPKIDVSTYHGSKGREADVVVLNTDVYKRTWDEQERSPDVETRLAYVGLTRARDRAIILNPRTSMYMRALVEN